MDIIKFQLTHFPTDNLDNVNIKYKSFTNIYWEYLKEDILLLMLLLVNVFLKLELLNLFFFY